MTLKCFKKEITHYTFESIDLAIYEKKIYESARGHFRIEVFDEILKE